MTAIIICVVLMVLAVGIDQLSKYLVVANMELYDSVDIIPGVLRFTYIQNEGAAFGSMDEHRWIFMILSTVTIIAIIAYMFWKKPQNKLLLASLVLITGGGIGNMIDRISLEYVIDFIDFCAFPSIWMWVFNLADSFVCIGAGLMALWLVLDTVKEAREAKAKKLIEGTETETPDENNGGNADE